MNDVINRYGLCRVDTAEKMVDKIIDFLDSEDALQDISRWRHHTLKDDFVNKLLEWDYA